MGGEEKGSAEKGENSGAAAITAASQGLGQAIGDLLVKLFGPVAEEAGQSWASQYRAKRKANLEKILPKAAQKAEAAGTERVRPPMSVAIPMIEKASLEEDAFMQEKWASLLAASVSPAMAGKVRKGFPQILSELEPLDAKVLEFLYESGCVYDPPESHESTSVGKIGEAVGIPDRERRIVAQSLLGLGLCRRPPSSLFKGPMRFAEEGAIALSGLGVDFVECCRA